VNKRHSPNFTPQLPHRSVLVVLFILAFSQVIHAETKQVGFVLQMQGVWLINGSPIPSLGAGLPAGGVVTLSPQTNFRSDQKWLITIVLLNNEIIPPKPNECNSFTSCKALQPIHLPTSLVPSSTVSARIQKAVAHLLSLYPERYAPTISRAAGPVPEKLHDAVLLLNQHQISIADWFHEIEPGAYALTFVDIGRRGRSQAPVTVNFHWNGGKPASIAANDLDPGLYVVRVFPEDSEADLPISQDTWVLLSSGDQFDKSSEIYHDSVERTRHWKNVDSGAVQTFLHACLDQLAAPVPVNGIGN
jgi:hypothetical protein